MRNFFFSSGFVNKGNSFMAVVKEIVQTSQKKLCNSILVCYSLMMVTAYSAVALMSSAVKLGYASIILSES